MTILPAALGIVLNEEQQVLLIKRRDVPVWVLPGGGVEAGESAEEALIREVKEETGVAVAIERLCAEYVPINALAAFTSLFLCSIQSGAPHPSDEAEEVAFFSLEKLPTSLFHLHALWLQECLIQTEVIRRPLTEVSYPNLFFYLIRHPWQVLRFAWTRWTRGGT